MNDDAHRPSHGRRKCPDCGLVNVGSDKTCRRCGTALHEEEFIEHPTTELAVPLKPKKRSLLKRLLWIVSATAILLMIFYASLLFSADKPNPNQLGQIQSAIDLLQMRGFSREAFVLNHVASFRTTDNWLNAYVGHHDAYAATNFPFEIVTLYGEFFDTPVDDRERAAVLLHEARHLLGDGEEAALRNTWMSKQRLGWTADRYKQTRVWDATERLTRAQFPYLFQCGTDGKADCY